MVGQPSTLAREYLSGSLASSLTYSIFSPLEVVKTRNQLQGTRPHSGMLRALTDNFCEDGVLLFWRHGLAPGILRDFFYSGMRTGMYPTVRNAICKRTGEASMAKKIAAGAITGSVGAGLANGFDVFRVRMFAECGRVDPQSGLLATGLRAGHKPRWPTLFHCAADAARDEGALRGLLMCGVGPSMARAGLLTAAQMATYDHMKTMAKRHGMAAEGTQLHTEGTMSWTRR